ncbi:MAG TPA: AAA family ATPase, partial [Pyrinomonadaceae bacterium]|nr:AAA family ATPase [Pyrinomonadaceae bacterium]
MKTKKISFVVALLVIFSMLLSAPASRIFGGIIMAQSAPATRSNNAAHDEMQASYPSLSLYATDLTRLARQGRLNPVEGHDREIQHLVRVLARRTGKSPVVISDSTVERNNIVEGLALKIASADVPDALSHKSIFRLNLDSMFAETAGGEQFEQKLSAVLADAERARGSVVLFIDELHQFVGTSAAQEASALISKALQSGDLQVVGATNQAAFDQSIQSNVELARLFERVGAANEEVADNESESDSESSEEFVGAKLAPDVRQLVESAGSNEDRVSLILQGDGVQNSSLRQYIKSNGGSITASLNQIGAQVVEVPARL